MKRYLLRIAGWLCLALGAVGIPLPILPTTPFVILAAICFSASDPKLYERLLASRLFGPYIAHWKTKQGIRPMVKVRAIAMLWGLLILTMFLRQKLWLTCLLIVIGVGVTIHLLWIKTDRS